MSRRPAAALALFLLAALACTRERLAAGIYRCAQGQSEIASGDWHGLEIGMPRRAALHRLRELGFGEVRGLARSVAVATGDPLAPLAALPHTARWELRRAGPRPAAIVWFEPDGVRVGRVALLERPGRWSAPLRGERERSGLLERLRPLLDSGEIAAIEASQAVYRASASEPEDEAVAQLAVYPEWETGRERWWGRESLELAFEGERLTRLRIGRLLFLH
jgi:hypothetical protein